MNNAHKANEKEIQNNPRLILSKIQNAKGK